MNIKDFLVENYGYIIIVVVLTIVTIIGFLADKKKNKDKLPKTMGGTIENQQGTNTTNLNYQTSNAFSQPVNYQAINNNTQSNNAINNNVIPNNMTNNIGVQDNYQMNMSSNQMINPVPQINQTQDNQNTNLMNNQSAMNSIPNQGDAVQYNIPQPVEQLNQNIAAPSETMYQPLSEQKPVIKPTMPDFNNNNINNIVTPNNFNQNNINPTPNVIPSVPFQTEQQQVPVMPIPNQIPQPMNQPVEPIPNVVGNTIPNPITPPQPASPQQINFVYGGGNQNQGNNNQFMQ